MEETGHTRGLMLIGGLMAFLNPFAASLAAEAVAGAAFLIAGVLLVWQAFTNTTKTPAIAG